MSNKDNNNKIYLRATLITICLIIANQFFIQYWLYKKKGDAEIINLSGRQRMISQQLINYTYSSKSTLNVIEQKEVKELYDEWVNVHAQLLGRYEPKPFSVFSNADIHFKLNNLTPLIEKSGHFIYQSKNEMTARYFEVFRVNQDDFLQKMNTIVFEIEAKSQWKLQMVIWIEILFALISLFLVYYEITFVFKKINQNLERQNKALGESNQMLEQYAYLAAHDLRSPTQNIINFAKLLEKGLDEKMDASEKSYFKFIMESAERMQNTTNDLLMFSTINHGKLRLEDCNPTQILKNVIKDINADIQEKQAKINIGELPDSIRADKTLFHIVFQNLISNGIKFVPKSVTPEVNINYESNEKQHIFNIQDNGIGINKEHQKKIFGFFKRLHRQEAFKGTGIGLSISQKVIEKHHGILSVQSELSKGSTFSFTISKRL